MDEISHLSIKLDKELQYKYKSLLAMRGMTQQDHIEEMIRKAVEKMEKEK